MGGAKSGEGLPLHPLVVSVLFFSQVSVVLRRQTRNTIKIPMESSCSHRSGRLSQTEVQMSIMLVAVTVTFLILTLPQYVRHVVFTFVHFNQTAERIALSAFLYHSSQKLYVTNSCVNFILYSATGEFCHIDIFCLVLWGVFMHTLKSTQDTTGH